MFYIGSSSVKRVQAGYRGSVSSLMFKKIWRQELKTNPHLFNTQIVYTCDTDKQARSKERSLQEQLDVIKSPLYINRSTAKVNGFFGSVGPAHNKRKLLWTDGLNVKYAFEPPGEGWYLGSSELSNINKSKAIRKHGKDHHNFGRVRTPHANKIFVEKVSKYYNVTLPNGEVLLIHGLNEFCKNHKLNVTGAHRVLTGTQSSYKNYKFERSYI